jgi:alpha-glucoside transport system substrate-binding protein
MRRTLAPAFTAAPSVVARTTFPASVAQLFALHPRVAMLLEGDFVPGVVVPAPAQLGVDVDVFFFPGPGPGPDAADRYVVGGGDVATFMRPPSRAAVELMRFLASPRAAEVWARRGGFVSPNEQVALDAYPDGATRTIARSLLDAGDGFHFDLSDLQPVAFGGTTGAGLWSLLRDFVAGKSDARQTATRLEAAADAAYGP